MTMSAKKFREWIKSPVFDTDDTEEYEVLSRVRVDDCVTITEIRKIRREDKTCCTIE